MKCGSLPLAAGLLLAATVQAVPLERRQAKGAPPPNPADLFKSLDIKDIHPYKIESLKPTMTREGVKRMRITYGPFDIMGAEEAKKAKVPFRMDPGSTTWMTNAKGLPTNVTVLMTNSTLQLENGEQAYVGNGIYNHHTVFFDKDKSTPIIHDCPSKSAAERAAMPESMPMTIFAGTSEDQARQLFSTVDGKFNSGFYMPNSDGIMFMGEVINYKNQTQKVLAVTDIEYVEGKPAGMRDAFSSVLSVNMCGPTGENGMPKDLALPPNQTKARLMSDPIIVRKDGYILHGKGHLHDGGESIVMKVNDKVVCVSTATYGGDGQEYKSENGQVWAALSSMGECKEPVRVRKGDKIALEANYDFNAHPARKHAGGVMGEAEVMAIIGATFAFD